MKHDENKDIKLLSKVAKIDERMKVIQIAKSQLIGNKRWGRLDFLTNHCGYRIVWNSAALITVYQNKKNNDNEQNTTVKEKKELHKLSNKNNKNNKKK